MSASLRPFLSAASGLIACVLVLVAVFFCVVGPAKVKALSLNPGVKTLLAKGNAANGPERFEDALISYEKALALINKDDFPEEWVNVAIKASQNHLALQDYTGALILLTNAVGVCEQHCGPETHLRRLTRVLLAMVRRDARAQDEAEALLRHALTKSLVSFGKASLEVAADLKNLVRFLKETHLSIEAEPLMRRALSIDEASFSNFHLEVVNDLNLLAQLLQDTHSLAEAEMLMRRALTIGEVSFGKYHPNVAPTLNNLALLLQATNRLAEAEPMMRRVIAIFVSNSVKNGRTDPTLETVTGNYRDLLVKMGDTESEAQEKLKKLMEPIAKK